MSILACLLIAIPQGFAVDDTDMNDTLASEDGEVLADDYYFDCNAENDGNGSYDSPFNNFTEDRIKEGSVIHLANGEYNLTNDISRGEISFYGESTQNTVLNGNGYTLEVDSALTFKNITLKNIHIQTGSLFTLNASNTIFKDSGSKSSLGGVIYSPNVGTITLTNCSFHDNVANKGGAIYMEEGSMEIFNTSFYNNSADLGGAIYSNNVIMDVYNSTFVNNTVQNGGAVYSKRSLALYNSTFANNTARYGGVIYEENGKVIEIYNSTFDGNTAEYGGVVYVKGGELIIDNSTFNDNSASYGGVIYSINSGNMTLSHSSFSNNVANHGGAIYGNTVNIEMFNTTFVSNSANYGGAMYAKGGKLIIDNSTFNDNSANFSGIIYSDSIKSTKFYNSSFNNNIAKYGGVIYVKGGGLISLNSTFVKNSASYGGVIDANGAEIIESYDSSFVNNSASDGGVFYGNGGKLIIGNSTFDGNSANNGGVVYSTGGNLIIGNSTFDGNSAKLGGVVNVKNTNLVIDNSTFDRNSANRGGVIYVDSSIVIESYKSSFNFNSAEFGGVIYVRGGELIIDNSTFADNSASYFGGAITSIESKITVNRTSYVKNDAGIEGGAIYIMLGNLLIDNSKFISNHAGVAGGLFIDRTSDSSVTNSLFESNVAEFSAGAIYLLANSNSTIDNLTFKGNSSLNYNDLIETLNPYLFNNEGNYTMYTYNSSYAGELPSSYSLRDEGYVTSVKNQGSGGNCWAFAALGALESCILKASGLSMDLSEENMKNLMALYSDYGWNMKTNTGGYDDMGIGYLVGWLGPINESEDAYNPSDIISPILTSLMHVQNIVFLTRDNYTDNDNIKRAILDYGAVSTCIAWYNKYKNNEKSYYCNNPDVEQDKINHAVLIVGWDDNYSKDNFANTPPGDGAWIIKNSHGENDGDHGYWYVSYYDVKFAKPGTTDVSFTFVLNDTILFDKNYQYDVPGKTDYFLNSSSTVWYKNIFNATDNEYLAAVSTYFNKDTNWEVSIYVNNDLKLTQSGFSKVSYSTINLNELIPLKIGDIFEVVFKITVDGEASFPISEKVSLNNYFYKENISFLSYDGENWLDIYNLSCEYPGHIYYSQVACIKAFTVFDLINTTIGLTSEVTDGFKVKANVLNQYNRPVSGGNVTFDVNGEIYQVPLVDGFAVLELFDVPKEYNITAIYENTGYISSKDNISLKTYLINTQLNLTVNGTYNPVDIIAYVVNEQGDPIDHGNVTFTLDDGTQYCVNVTNGVATLTQVFKTFGKHTVSAVFNSIYYYTSSNIEQKDFNVSFVNTTMKLTVDKQYNPILIQANVTDQFGNAVTFGNVTFIVEDVPYTVDVVEGIASLSYSFNNMGSNIIRAVYDGLYYYNSSSFDLDVNVNSTIIAGNATKTYNSQYQFILLDSYGNPLNNTQVIVKINSNDYEVMTDENGTAILTITLKPAEYSIIITNPTNNDTKTQIINVLSRISENKDMTMYYGASKYYKVKVLDDDGNVAKGVDVTFTYNNKKYTRTTDKNGYASFKIPKNIGKYTITAEYKGFKVSNKITVKSTIITKNIKVKKGKTIKFKAKLLNKNGKALKNKKITFKFKGKTYKIKTNKKGKATLKITKKYKVGKYTIKTSYGGLKIKNTIKIK
jgi:predicted outer membrane repeat protein